ncbi:hypothetical protein DFH08DRAFT_910804 [Mycena albidolilacea]|uniref:Uncharacterized protein n=1 Tax=Mycena albidolilacea TaxID=1033008 RepID=A0AAD7AM99_9AGAR|nr:hypothetical protein DFH08DRAFT_910804 [Mycena albidolilacea]
MRECRTPDVPTFTALRKKQAELTKDVNIQTVRHTSAMSNEFYMNHPAQLLALDWANPLVRKFIQVYPEVTDKISELNHADKWLKEVDFDDLSPMWADWKSTAHKHFYIKELAQLKNSDFVIPMRWIIFNKEEYAEMDRFVIHDDNLVRVQAMDLKYNYLDLKEARVSFNFPGYMMPNPVRKLAKGRPVFSMRIVPWSDDVSGNVSKQFNPHMNVCMVNGSLPHRKVTQEYFVRFCSTWPHASSGEQFEALVDDIGPEKYHDAYDCLLEQEILFRIYVHVLPADNPQQAESASTAGVHANLWCRYDLAGGTAAHRETNEGYCALFKPGVPRTPAETIRVIKRQIWAACTGVQDTVDEFQTSTGVKDKTALFWIEQLTPKAREVQKARFRADPRLKNRDLKGNDRKAVKARIKDLIQWELYNWVIRQPEARWSKLPRHSAERYRLRPGDHYNILLNVRGLDPHQDSPCEILHSILLGDTKYIWHATNSPWNKIKEDQFAIRLQSSSTDGLNLTSLCGRYMVRDKNSLIGKHFKVLQQLGAFHLHDDLCGKKLFSLWKAAGELGALLWYSEIRNQEQYLADLQTCIDNVLDIWGLIDPARILTKYKLHVLSHLPDDVRGFGPAILFATEGFEGWNGVFRLCSILSNHQAPSRDIGVTLADMDGGWWKPHGSEDYIQAGHEIVHFLQSNKELQRRLGWMDKLKMKAGQSALHRSAIKLDSCRTAVSGPWREVLASLWSPELDNHGAGKNWTSCKYVISQAGDPCKKRLWIFFKSQLTGTVLAGHILNIVIPMDALTKHDQALVIVQRFNQAFHCMNMPVLSPSPEYVTVKPADILFIFNAQHDCNGSKCRSVAGGENIIQERHITDRTQTVIQHAETDSYFINLHALHNAHLLRDTLPRNLTAPVPYFKDHQQKREEFAALVRVSGPAKRAATAKKSKETREKKKQAKASRERDEEETEDSDDVEN